MNPLSDEQAPALDESERDTRIREALYALEVQALARESAADALVGRTDVRGYNLEGPFDIHAFLGSLTSTGFQARALGEAIAITREMRERRVPIYLAITSNVGTCGLRDNVTYLVKNRHLSGLAATAGAIEEDVMKVLKPFVLGEATADDAELRGRSVCRTGDILIPGNRYAWLHTVLWALHRRLARERQPNMPTLGVVDYVFELGRQLDLLELEGREASFVFQAYRTNTPVYCPALLDGAIGDAIYYLRRSAPEFVLDVSECHQRLIEDMIVRSGPEIGLGIIAVGGSVPKHLLCNSAIFSGGASHLVYITTASEMDGSNAGASPSEAISWGKLRPNGRAVKVHAEATLAFPLLLVGAFQTHTYGPGGNVR